MADTWPARERFWLALTLLFAALPAAVALSGFLEAWPYVVQDDARQFVVWMRRWQDPMLFQGDPIADYFASVTPLGFKALYWPFVKAGLDPVLINALLPLPMSLAVGWLAFRLGRLAGAAPPAAWLGATLTLFFLWLVAEGVASALPRSFAVPLLLALLVQLAEGRAWAAALAVAGLALTYPQIALVALVMLAGWPLAWERGSWRPRVRRERLAPALAGIAAGCLALAPFALASSGYGPTITAAEARLSPLFQTGGRTAFFFADPFRLYLCSARGGLLPVEWGCGEAFRVDRPGAPWLGLALALAAAAALIALARRPSPAAGLPLRAALAGLMLWLLAHLLLFALHLPARYAQHSLRAVVLIAAGILIAEALGRLLRRLDPGLARRGLTAGLASAALGFYALPFVLPTLPRPEYVVGAHPGLYRFLETTPKDSLIGSLSPEADSLPAFASRPVLTAREFLLPYSRSYFLALAGRTGDLVALMSTQDRAELGRLIERLGVDYLLLDGEGLAPIADESAWWRDVAPEAISSTSPALLDHLARDCVVYSEAELSLVSAACLLERTRP